MEGELRPRLEQFWKNAGWSSLHPVQVGVGGPIVLVNLLVILAVVQVGSLFSADAWNNITFTAGEVKNPRRNMPLSLVLGTGFVLTVYFLVSLAYMLVLPLHGDPHGATALARGIQYATEDRVATAALAQIFHSGGAQLMAAAILISTFGCANGMTLAGARVYYAMSRDGLFFKAVGKLHPRYKTPVAGLAGAGRLDGAALPLRHLQPASRLHHLCRDAVLYPHHRWAVRAALQVACRAAPLQGARLSGSARALYRDGRHGSVSYYCGTSPSTRGRDLCWYCLAFPSISFGRAGRGPPGASTN